jgi:LPS O-antigen subunit length determinant protein (WzzB/FepE family)
MKSLIRRVARLYPPRWRDRYGAELDALLQDGDPDLWDLFDVLKGALAMRLSDVGLITAGFALLGALVAGFVSLKIPETYASTAMLDFRAIPTPIADVDTDSMRKVIHDTDSMRKLIYTSFSQKSLAAIIKNENLYNYRGDRDDRSVDGLINRMRLAIRLELVRPGANSDETKFRITFVDQDRAKAQRVTENLIGLMMEANVAQPPASAARLYMREPPRLAASPTNPNRVLITVLGFAVGLVIGAIVAWLWCATCPRMA